MGRAAFSLWNERIAPVFDVARNLWIVEVSDGQITGQTGRRFSTDDPDERAANLESMQVEALVCGAITRKARNAITDRGVKLVSFVAGDLEQVIQAWLSNSLDTLDHSMPGCGRGRRRLKKNEVCRGNLKREEERLCQTGMDRAQ